MLKEITLTSTALNMIVAAATEDVETAQQHRKLAADYLMEAANLLLTAPKPEVSKDQLAYALELLKQSALGLHDDLQQD